jgi:predicted RNase H-like nuclease (RuvC/YqgF family)
MRTKKGSKPAVPAVEDDERHTVDVDDFVSRNRDALNQSIHEARQDVAAGKVSKKTIDDIVAEGRSRHRRSA